MRKCLKGLEIHKIKVKYTNKWLLGKIMDFFLCSKNKPGVAKARCKNKAQYKKIYWRGMRFVNKLSA